MKIAVELFKSENFLFVAFYTERTSGVKFWGNPPMGTAAKGSVDMPSFVRPHQPVLVMGFYGLWKIFHACELSRGNRNRTLRFSALQATNFPRSAKMLSPVFGECCFAALFHRGTGLILNGTFFAARASSSCACRVSRSFCVTGIDLSPCLQRCRACRPPTLPSCGLFPPTVSASQRLKPQSHRA